LLLVLVISIALAIPAPLRAAYPQHVRQNSQSKVEAVEKVDTQRGDYYYYYETPTYYYYEFFSGACWQCAGILARS